MDHWQVKLEVSDSRRHRKEVRAKKRLIYG
jgi:hypothetical protein